MKNSKGASTAGFGTVGYCKLCSIADPVLQDEYDKRVGSMTGDKYDYTPARLNEWLENKGVELRANRQTVYIHRDHVKHPKDKIVSAVKKREIEHGVQPQQVSEEAFLDSLITIGQRKIEADPDAVTIDQALKATQIKRQSGGATNAQAVLVQIMTGGPEEPTVEVEGEVRTI
jgi:hypothetical protein